MRREEKMGATKDQAIRVHTRKNFKKKEKKEKFHHKIRRTINKRRPREILQIFDAMLVMKMDTLQEIFPSRKGDTMLMLPNTMNQKTKD